MAPKFFLYGVRLAEVKTITEDNDGIGCERMVFVVFINQLCQIISQYIKPLVYHIEMFAAEPSCIVAKLYRFYFRCQSVTVAHGVCGKNRFFTESFH